MADYRVDYNFLGTDQRNFLVLLGSHLKSEGLELIPSGFILKKPEVFITNETNTYIDVIGIPFRNVYNRVRLYYHRVTLSEFYGQYKNKLGTRDRPLRVKANADIAAYTEAIKKLLERRLEIPRRRFIVEPADLNISPKAFKFKFTIEELEYTTADEGLSLYNDKEVFIFVEEYNIETSTGYARIPATSYITSYSSPYSLIGQIRVSGDYDVLSTDDGLVPEEYKPVLISIAEDFSSIDNYRDSDYLETIVVKVKMPNSSLRHPILTGFNEISDKLEYSIDTESGTLEFLYDSTKYTDKVVIRYHIDEIGKDIEFKVDPLSYLVDPSKNRDKYLYSRIRTYDSPQSTISIDSIVLRSLEVVKYSLIDKIAAYDSPQSILSIDNMNIKYDINLKRIMIEDKISVYDSPTSILSVTIKEAA